MDRFLCRHTFTTALGKYQEAYGKSTLFFNFIDFCSNYYVSVYLNLFSFPNCLKLKLT